MMLGRKVKQCEANRQAVERAYREHGEGLYRYAVMVLTDEEAAQDVIQQVFMRLLGMGERVLAVESLAGYLRRAVRNGCYDALRRGRGQEAVNGQAILESVGEQGLGADEREALERALRALPAEQRLGADEREALERALRALPAEQREVVHMKVYEGKTFREMAGALGVSANTAASRYRYAMAKLRERLG